MPLLPDPLAGMPVGAEALWLAHTPVVFPQALHHWLCEPMANLFIPRTKSVQLISALGEPNSGYGCGVLLFPVVPLWKRNLTCKSDTAGNGVAGAVVKSSNVIVEA